MTFTYNEIVSRIQHTLNTLNKDMFIPRRYILSIFKAKAEFYMAQKLNDKSLFRETNLFKWINCVKMEEAPSNTCGVELQSCTTVMKSRKKLPKLLWSRYGSSTIMVTNIDGSKEYQIISQAYYNNIKNKPIFKKFKGKFAIIYPDNYLYIPDSEVKIVNILIFSLDEKCDDSSECEDDLNEKGGSCRNYWETEIEVPDKMSEVIIQETLKEVAMRVQIPEDENENNDSNIKSREQ